MSRYEDFCRAYFEYEARAVIKDRVMRELPLRMREAISDYLAPPNGPALLPTAVYHSLTRYVDFYRGEFDPNGQRKYERCGPDDCLQFDSDGIGYFSIGICMTQSPVPSPGSMVYFTMSVEEVDAHSVQLATENLSGSIVIDLRDPAGYTKAATEIVDRLMTFLKDPETITGRRAPIGFALPAQLPE